MNENIERLLKQVWPDPKINHDNHLKFAELIVKECLRVMDQQWNDPAEVYEAMQDIEKHFGVE